MPPIPPDTPPGLRHVSDRRPGISRRKCGKGFAYYDPTGKRIVDKAMLARLRSLAVPPAYRDVWICPSEKGHLQATGIDARGRKQYRYHAKWRARRDEDKFAHILQFAEALPGIRAQVKAHLQLPGLPREKVLAAVVRLLETTLIRVGNSEYARHNDSYGLTTIRKKHVAVEGSTIRFEFTGKSGKRWSVSVNDRRIAAIVRRCAETPGYELFKYLAEDGSRKDVTSSDVNAYLKEITGQEFTAKDFRIWSGTVLAALALREFEKYDSAAQAKRNVVRAIDKVARQLGNTPSICRQCYVHPEILNSYLSDGLKEMIEQEIAEEFRGHFAALSTEEVMVLAFLRRKLRR